MNVGDAFVEPGQSVPLRDMRPAVAVVADLDVNVGAVMPDDDVALGGVRVFGDVGECFGDDEVGRVLDGGWEPLAVVESYVEVDLHRRTGGDGGEGGCQPAVDEDGRGDAARQRAKLGDRLASLLERFIDHRFRPLRVSVELALYHSQVHRGAGESLLRAVVQVALDDQRLRNDICWSVFD